MSTQDARREDVRKTYRYLRIGILGATSVLVAGVIVEMFDTSCVLTSISAYYYTPVRAAFVGALLAIGLALIVIKGERREDLALNVAGMLAPVVAFIPIRSFDKIGNCTVRDPLRYATSDDLNMFLDLSVRNNMIALISAGIAGLIVTIAVIVKGRKSAQKRARANQTRQGTVEQESLGDLAVFLGLAAFYTGWFWLFRPGFIAHAHLVSAGGMFLALAFGAWVTSGKPDARFRTAYRRIAYGMVGAGLVLGASSLVFEYWILVLEVIEILLFATYWILQTIDNWRVEGDRSGARSTHPRNRMSPDRA